MGFAKFYANTLEFQGTSFSKAISRKDGEVFDSKYSAEYEVRDENNELKSDDDLTRSGDDKSFIFEIPETDTTDWLGNYKLVVYLLDSTNAAFKRPIYENNMEYNDARAR